MKNEQKTTATPFKIEKFGEFGSLKISFPVNIAALKSLAEGGVSIDTAVSIFAPHSEKDCQERIAGWFSQASRGLWRMPKALAWMQAAPHKKKITIVLDSDRWEYVKRASFAVGVSPADWCVAAIGYRAVILMTKCR